MKLLIIGDVHRTGMRPLSRTDDYVETQDAKLAEALEIGRRERCECVIQTGDLFDSPDPAMRVISALENQIKDVRMLAVPGGHDEHGHNLASIGRTAFGHLAETGRIRDVSSDPLFESNVTIEGCGFSTETDRDLGDYLAKHPEDGKVTIHVAHGMLLERAPGYDAPHTLLSDVAAHPRCPDVVICGHVHAGFGVKRLPRAAGGEVVFINPGALVRKTADVAEIERTPQVCLLEVYPGTGPRCHHCGVLLSNDMTTMRDYGKGVYLVDCPHCDGRYTTVVFHSQYGPPELWATGHPVIEATLIPLSCALPGHEVISRSHIEAAADREARMGQFLGLLSREGEARFIDLQSMIEGIARSENLPRAVVDEGLRRIAAARESLGGRAEVAR